MEAMKRMFWSFSFGGQWVSCTLVASFRNKRGEPQKQMDTANEMWTRRSDVMRWVERYVYNNS